MSTTFVKVSAKYAITIPQMARKKLNTKKGDRLLVDVQEYLNGERDAWTDRGIYPVCSE